MIVDCKNISGLFKFNNLKRLYLFNYQGNIDPPKENLEVVCIEKLNINNNDWSGIVNEIVEIEISGSTLTHFPSELSKSHCLKYIYLRDVNFTENIDTLNLVNLQCLDTIIIKKVKDLEGKVIW